MEFRQSIRWVPPSRDPVLFVQFLFFNGLLPRQAVSYQEPLRNHLSLFQVGEEALASLEAHHAWTQVREVPVMFTKHGHVTQHFSEGVNFTTQAALDLLALKFRRRMNNLAGYALI